MKKLFLAILILVMARIGYTAPFLVCDPPSADQQVTSYEVFQDGVSIGTTPAPLRYDLNGLTPGVYNFTAIAINAWGASDPANPYISPAAAQAPSGLTMEP